MRVMVVGPIGCGKTTLCQALAGLPRVQVKTQTVQLVGNAIDTPGEYMENRRYTMGLMVAGADADLVLFLLDSTRPEARFSPGQAAMFGRPVVGVVTKTDRSDPKAQEQARQLLRLAGAGPVFVTSAETGQGLDALGDYLRAQEKGL